MTTRNLLDLVLDLGRNHGKLAGRVHACARTCRALQEVLTLTKKIPQTYRGGADKTLACYPGAERLTGLNRTN